MEDSVNFVDKSKSWFACKVLQITKYSQFCTKSCKSAPASYRYEKKLLLPREPRNIKEQFKYGYLSNAGDIYERCVRLPINTYEKRVKTMSIHEKRVKPPVKLYNQRMKTPINSYEGRTFTPIDNYSKRAKTPVYVHEKIPTTQIKTSISIDDYNVGKLLGSGKFSKVYLAKDKFNNTDVAIKVITKDTIIKDKLEHQIVREVNNLNKLQHPNIIKLLTFFSDNTNIYLVLEHAAGGELYWHLRNSPMKRFSNRTAAVYVYQVADALEFCHRHKVIHRDIKPENLLLDHEGNIKLSDFGWSVYTPKAKRKTLCGTLDYIAPEMINREYYDEAVDNWCLGVLCYEFLVGKPPFHCKDKKDTFKKIIALQVDYPYYMCLKAKDLISRLLQKNPRDRLSLQKVKCHNWIVSKMAYNKKSLSLKKEIL